jgi:hypothetical protein
LGFFTLKRIGCQMRVVLLLSLLVTLCTAQESGLKIWGSLQNDISGIQTSGNDDRFGYTGWDLLTLNIKNRNSASVKVEGSADVTVLYGMYADKIRQQGSGLLFSNTRIPILFDLRKLYAGFFLPFGDLFIGRQIINYGEGKVFSPVDVFSSINIFDLTFKRHGSDVLRFRIPFGTTSGAELTGGITQYESKPVGALKLYSTLKGVEMSMTGMYRSQSDEIMTGLAFKGDLIAGFYGEAAEHFGANGSHRYFEGMFGADYSISNMWFFNAEYLYSEKGVYNDSSLSSSAPSIQLTGRHNLFLSCRYAFNDISNVTLSGIADLEKENGFLTAQYSYNILQNADLTVYTRYFHSGNSSAFKDLYPDMQYGVRIEAFF